MIQVFDNATVWRERHGPGPVRFINRPIGSYSLRFTTLPLETPVIIEKQTVAVCEDGEDVEERGLIAETDSGRLIFDFGVYRRISDLVIAGEFSPETDAIRLVVAEDGVSVSRDAS